MPPSAQDPCWRPAVFRPAPSAPARSVRVSHDSDPTSGHDPCPKPKPNPNPNPRQTCFRHVRRIEAVPTGGPAWPQQRKASGRVGHPVERYGQRALFNVAPKPKPNSSSSANLCSRSRPPSRSADPAAPLLPSLDPRPLHQSRLGETPVLVHRRGSARARPRVRVRFREREGLRARQSRGRARALPGIGLGEEPAMWVGVGRQPWGSGVASARAKRFGVSQLVLRRGDQGDK